MTPRPKGSDPEGREVPSEFPGTTPPASTNQWVMTSIADMREAVGKLNGTLVAIQSQVGRIEGKVDDIKTKVDGHGNWMHTTKVLLGVIGTLLVVIIAPIVVLWAKHTFWP